MGSTLGTLQTFNMTAVAEVDGKNVTTIYKHLFGVRVNHRTTLQFSFWDPQGAEFVAYFDNRTGDVDSLFNEITTRRLETLENQSAIPPKQFSGQIHADKPGLYIFTFSAPWAQPTNQARFLLRDSTAYGNGIRISLDASGKYGKSGPCGPEGGLEKWMIKLYSDSATDVNMSALSVQPGIWAKFTPSYIRNVGPKGASTTLLIAGATTLPPFVPNSYNISLFIDARGANDLSGETFLPVVQTVPVQVLHAPGPIHSLIEANHVLTVLTTGQTGSGSAVYGVVYDPVSASANKSLSVNMTVSGILENGKMIQPVPSWLKIYLPQQTFQLVPEEPYYFGFSATFAPDAPSGRYTLVLKETINGQDFNGYFEIELQANRTGEEPLSPPNPPKDVLQGVVDEAVHELQRRCLWDKVAELTYGLLNNETRINATIKHRGINLGFWNKTDPEVVKIVQSVIDKRAPGTPLDISENITFRLD
ncbi:MAG: hypothetical protein HYY22_09290 [Thaumarchaeota archaeon]|nr:hypothetical protein [Nitrososphaerota archaeon]